VGSAPEASVWENSIVNRRREFFRRGFLDSRAISRFTGELFERYGITGNPKLRIGSLSGGNIQKVILAREIDQYRDYIVFSEPTRGLDVASGRYIYKEMAALRDRGAAVILISSNLDEILINADRILVFYRGAITAEFRDIGSYEAGGYATGGYEAGMANGDMFNIKEEIGAYMLGLKTQRREAAENPAGGDSRG
jgi:simple sugar transport system ATP-binding protein